MGVKITVDTQRLVSASKEIAKSAASYKTTSENIFNEVNSMSSAWQGADNQAFVNQISGFREDFKKMDDLLNLYADMLLIVDKEYKKTVEASYAIAGMV